MQAATSATDSDVESIVMSPATGGAAAKSAWLRRNTSGIRDKRRLASDVDAAQSLLHANAQGDEHRSDAGRPTMECQVPKAVIDIPLGGFAPNPGIKPRSARLLHCVPAPAGDAPPPK
jgi:hypothetical protein